MIDHNSPSQGKNLISKLFEDPDKLLKKMNCIFINLVLLCL
jgi:hypothetical protein